jgi:hypothetical protein
MSTFIGMFAVDQRRKRQLYTDKYSHVLVVFDTGLILVEAAPVRDYLVATAHRVPVPIPHAPIARTVLRLGPKFGLLKKNIAQLKPLTPETLAASYPSRARRVWNDQIRSAVLKGSRRADLKIKYVSDKDSRPMELWFTISLAEDSKQVRATLATMLGDRFRVGRRGVLAAVTDALSVARTVGDFSHGLAERSEGYRSPPAR